MSEKDNEIRNLSGIIKEDNIEKGFDSLSEIRNSSFDNKKNNSFITDQSIDTNLRVSLNNTSTSKKKSTDIDKMLPLFIEKLSQNMQNVDFKLSLNKSPTNPSNNNEKIMNSPENISSNNTNNYPTTNSSNGVLNNQKQKEAITMKYNNLTNNSMTTNKHINNNFNVIDEIVEEDLISRASISANNSDLEICILNGQTADQKISEKLKNKLKNNTEKNKQQSFMKSTNKSSSNLNQTSKIKNYIKENKTKISTENPFPNNNIVNTEFTTHLNESSTNRNIRTNRISPDYALNRKENNKGEREGISKDIKKDDRKRVLSRTPPKTINQERGINKDTSNSSIVVNRDLGGQGGHNIRKPSVSPDVKRDVKKPKVNENTFKKMDRIEKIDKLILEKENARNKKASLNISGNMNIKKAIKLKEKEQQKIEENNKGKIKNKVVEKHRYEAKNALHYQKDSINKMRTERSENNLEEIPSINCDTKEFFEIICIVSELFSSSPGEIKKVLKNIVDLNKSESDICSNNDLTKKTLNQSIIEYDRAALTIQRKWREYKLAALLDLPYLTKQDLFQRSKLLLLDTLMKHSEFKRILNLLSQLTQLWKEFTSKKQGIKRVTNTLASCEENNYMAMSESITLLLKSNRDSRVFTIESEIK